VCLLPRAALIAFSWKSDCRALVEYPEVRYWTDMTNIRSLFATRLFQASLGPIDQDELRASCYSVAEDDDAGNEWCEANDFPGYTSYASLTDLPWRFPIFADVVTALDDHVKTFAEDLEFNLDGRKLVLEDIWINILPEGGVHTSHIHPHSVISGTTYVKMPEGASALKLEDPRSQMMMAAPARKPDAREEMKQFVYIKPVVGDVLMWESWLRHEVPMNMSEDDRISVSFNYRWD
jgi:uncharacterized protein (TIGR02466 family)